MFHERIWISKDQVFRVLVRKQFIRKTWEIGMGSGKGFPIHLLGGLVRKMALEHTPEVGENIVSPL